MKLQNTTRVQFSTLLAIVVLITLLSSVAFSAKTFTVQETEEISLEINATDPDNDNLIFGFTNPFDERGVWKTTYDDAGEYTILVTVSDGVDSDVQEVKVTVENVNRPPLIDSIVNIG